jgi:hypothetical protein
MEELIAFLSGSETYTDLADFSSYKVSSNIALDQSNGLDSWMSDKDRNMLKYYRESDKNGGH